MSAASVVKCRCDARYLRSVGAPAPRTLRALTWVRSEEERR
jgi:hypothetical protein